VCEVALFRFQNRENLFSSLLSASFEHIVGAQNMLLKKFKLFLIYFGNLFSWDESVHIKFKSCLVFNFGSDDKSTNFYKLLRGKHENSCVILLKNVVKHQVKTVEGRVQ
jgi:hypothetical protein